MRSLLSRPAPSGGKILPQLDALRGVAILAVFTQHLGDRFMPLVEEGSARALPPTAATWLLTVLHHAHWGVDLFFVLSGFSLAQGYLRAFARGTPPLPPRAFLLRRAARILPAYYAALAITLATQPAIFHRPGAAASLAVHLALLQGYLTPGGIVIISATWSLTTEIGFYFLMPFLARPVLARRTRGLVVGGFVCLAAWASRAILHAMLLEPGVRTGLIEATQRRWITSRLDQFVLGMMAAALYAELSDRPRAKRLAPVAAVLAAAALCVGFRLEGELYLTPGGSWPYAIMSLATAALVLAAALCEGTALAVVAPWPLRFVGVVSYGVFLFHHLGLGLAAVVLPAPGWASLGANAVLALAISLVLGAASWVWVERPAMRWADGRSGARPRPAT